jgi:hypothetical protein
MLFLACSELNLGKLHSDLREYLACQKIEGDYKSQLESEQRADIKRRIEDASKVADNTLVSAYSTILKFSVKNGFEKLSVKMFRDGLDHQINQNIIGLLKEEEWLLEAVGLGTLRNNNLLPAIEQAVKVKEVYEAFLRFDDKPMITGKDAVSRSLQKYCYNGEFCIATGNGKEFTKFYFKENVPFFDVQDETYWLVEKSLKPQPVPATPASVPTPIMPSPTVDNPIYDVPSGGNKVEDPAVKKFKSISISGKVPLERYTELFNYFITPFAMLGNRIEIEVSFKIKSTSSSPLDESKQQYKSAKEAARQLSLNFDEEIED